MNTTLKRSLIFPGIIVFVSAVALSGCATKSYVRQQIAPVDTRLSELASTVEEHAERIDAVDNRAQQGISDVWTAAAAAQQSANQASDSAAAAGRVAETAQQGAREANNRVTAVENRLNALHNYSVIDTVTATFAFDSAALTDDARAALDRIAAEVRPGDFLELQGHTDSIGSADYNLGLSQRRAEAVQRHLISRNVDLFRISTAGLGKEAPAADNGTSQGREQNRRVEVRLLRASGVEATATAGGPQAFCCGAQE